MNPVPKYSKGDHVCSNSGLVYVIVKVRHDHGAIIYIARRLKGGVQYGPSRRFGECDLARWTPSIPIPSSTDV